MLAWFNVENSNCSELHDNKDVDKIIEKDNLTLLNLEKSVPRFQCDSFNLSYFNFSNIYEELFDIPRN